MKIGLLGGTFNPVHMGHLVLAQECWYRLGLDRVIFVPAYTPPHKEVESGISPADRLNMLRLAVADDDRFEISTWEMDSGRTSYSIDTINHFRQKFNIREDKLFFLTGADLVENLSEWKDTEAILSLSTFVAAARPGCSGGSIHEDRIRRIDIPGIEVSSSMIRARILNREPIDYLVPAPVVKYIRRKGLYRD